jgi:hypothetical protein
MKRIVILLALSIAALAQQPSASPIPPAVKQTIDAFLAARIKAETEPAFGPDLPAVEAEVGDHQELMADVNGDGIADLVMSYSLEGGRLGNGFNEYVAIWLGSAHGLLPPVITRVGGKWWAGFGTLAVEHGAIRLTGARWRERDPGCCPTGRIDIRFVLANGRLRLAPANNLVARQYWADAQRKWSRPNPYTEGK